jgi:hypothetical protein
MGCKIGEKSSSVSDSKTSGSGVSPASGMDDFVVVVSKDGTTGDGRKFGAFGFKRRMLRTGSFCDLTARTDCVWGGRQNR